MLKQRRPLAQSNSTGLPIGVQFPSGLGPRVNLLGWKVLYRGNQAGQVPKCVPDAHGACYMGK